MECPRSVHYYGSHTLENPEDIPKRWEKVVSDTIVGLEGQTQVGCYSSSSRLMLKPLTEYWSICLSSDRIEIGQSILQYSSLHLLLFHPAHTLSESQNQEPVDDRTPAEGHQPPAIWFVSCSTFEHYITLTCVSTVSNSHLPWSNPRVR